MGALRGAGRLATALGVALAGWVTIVFLFPRMTRLQREARVQAWAQRMLRAVGVDLRLHGRAPATGPVLLAANHISWLDILVMLAASHCRFVSKSDIRHWPLIGTLATGGGTLYIERESRRDAMRVVHRMAKSLQAGDVLAVFPEGTTSDGTALLPFHGNLIQAAISAGVPVQPVALQFRDRVTGAITLTPCYIDDDSLVGSLWRTLSGPAVVATVTYGQPEHCAGRGRRAWAQDLRAAVERLRQA